MNISGIRPNQGFYDYNSIKVNELRGQQIAVAMHNQELEVINQTPVTTDTETRPVEQNYTSFHFAQEYRPDETYELVGADSDIHSLDIQKAVSDLEKDQAIRQYQFFVNDDGINGFVGRQKDPAELVLRSGENFML